MRTEQALGGQLRTAPGGAWPVPKVFENSEVVKTGRSGSEPEVRIPDPKIRLEFSIY